MTIMGAYDRWAWAYDDLIRNRNPVVELSYDWVLEVVGEWRGRQVCDLGCGQGELARRMAQRGAIVTAQGTVRRGRDEPHAHGRG